MFLTDFITIEHCELVQHTTETKHKYIQFKTTRSLKYKQTQEKKDDSFLLRTG